MRGILPRVIPGRAGVVLVLCMAAQLCGVGVPRARATEGDPTPAAAVPTAQQLAEERELIRLLSDTLEQVRSHYVDDRISERDLIEAAIEGMISRLDPYSHYIPPEELDQFTKSVEREFVGIGIQVAERDGHLQIISPLYGTPAWRAGLRAGDRILQIDETSVRGLSLNEAIRLMSGDPGTHVRVSVLHAMETEAQTVTLTRELIQQPSVVGYRRQADGAWDYFCDVQHQIGYLRITAFSRKTSEDVAAALQQLQASGAQGLVLDLRFNPGGMLHQAIEVSDLFLHEGRIVSVVGRTTAERSWDARDNGTLVPRGFPVAVLVNRFSASAAEIVSAALQDNHVAVVVGERTWGKGSVQNIVELERGKSALKLTTAGYQRPSGKNIHRPSGAAETDDWGVTPDDGYGIACNDRDLFELSRHLTWLDSSAEPSTQAAETSDTSDEPAAFVDRQLEKALDYVRGRVQPTPSAESVPPAETAGS